MPPDNAAAIAPGADVSFPQDGASDGTGVTRSGDGGFRLNASGVYLVLYDVAVEEAGQLVLTLNGEELPATVAGCNMESSRVTGMSLVNASADDLLTVRNPAACAESLTITPDAGGTQPVSAHLVIMGLSSASQNA